MTFSSDQGDLFGGFVAPADDDAREPLTVGAWPTDCANVEGVRPCPRVTCRHHLLLDLAYSTDTEPNLVINRARRSAGLVVVRGRRPELGIEATPAQVARFIDDALAALWLLPDTCSREVARRAALAVERTDPLLVEPQVAMTWAEVAAVLGVADPDELVEEFAEIRDGLRGEAVEAGADPDVEDEAAVAIVQRGRR